MILLLWAAACFALLVVDWCCWAPNRLDADMASEQLLANLLAQEGGVMSTNWYYSTELRVLNTQLVMAPLFRLFTSWHTVRVVGSVVLILLYLAAWFWFGRSAKLKYCGLLGAGLLVLPYGVLYRQYVLEGLYYIPHIAISFVVLGCAVRILRGGRRLAPAAGMVLFSFAAALGGPRQLFILNIPLTVAAALLCWLDAPPADTLRQKLTNAWRTPGGALLVPTLAADAAALLVLLRKGIHCIRHGAEGAGFRFLQARARAHIKHTFVALQLASGAGNKACKAFLRDLFAQVAGGIKFVIWQRHSSFSQDFLW